MAEEKERKWIFDEMKPHVEIIRDIPPVDMETGNLLDMTVELLKEEKVDTMFALSSGASFRSRAPYSMRE